ncbi:hypothetical protein PCG10_005050 [Penicillium crustosum]|uniref:Zn(2)-C6 fungal-type domain-containing protein n=1 Tax=Penicillium crustosum TaxID=36656 RepID=A0A9P5GUT2_PENCR|nr:uncharacterized protein N7487_006837 [Penicillium crustosum]KAF7530074.1 hypothetical protein PCG10_005050 [Penicillium crustosum]KAJ5412478.1 hypothetical protein N7487_006837 [Penicillium crustosum]
MYRNRIQTSRSSQTTPHTASSLQTPKLKDSCDKCSASKVRCTREKPFCSRCDKLGYTCFYSPARRTGRPYRSKKQVSEGRNSEEPNRLSARDITTTTQFVDESAKLYSRFNGSATPTNVTSNIPISSSTPPNNKAAQADHSTTKSHEVSDPDCLLVVLEIFSELEVLAEQLRRVLPVDTSPLNATAQTITVAFHRLSTVLICSCSQRAEVGMLVSAICISIIDIHAMAISNFAKDQPQTGLLSQPTPLGIPGVGLKRSPGNDVTAMHVFTELSELAKLILQLTERYNERGGALSWEGLTNESELPTEIMPGMATFLRERLQKITNDATYWLG